MVKAMHGGDIDIEPEAEREEGMPPPGYLGSDPLALYLLKKLDKAEAPPVSKQRFDWTINTGNVLVLLTMVIGGVAAYGAWTQTMTDLRATVSQNQKDIAANTEADRQRTAMYAPRIDTVEKLVATMAGRLDNQGDSLIELRKSITDLVKVSSEMHESLAIMKMQQDRDRDRNSAAPR